MQTLGELGCQSCRQHDLEESHFLIARFEGGDNFIISNIHDKFGSISFSCTLLGLILIMSDGFIQGMSDSNDLNTSRG